MASISDNPMSDNTSENANQLSVAKPSCILSTNTKVNTRKSRRVPSISDKYPRFYKLYRHPFGGRTSPYRERAEAWLRSLTKGSEHYPCQQCSSSGRVCDRKHLRCESCAERHACCPRTSSFKKLMIMQDLGITTAEYDQLAKLAPPRRKRPPVAAKARSDLIEEGREEQEIFDTEEEEEVDQLADDSPVPPSPRALAPASVSDLPVRSIRTSRWSRVSPYPTAVDARLSSGSRMRRAGFSATPPDLELVPLSAGTFNVDDGRLLKELAAIRLALAMAQEKLDALLSDHDIPEESLDVVEGSNCNGPDVVPLGISTHRVDVETSPICGSDIASQPRVPFEDVTQEFHLSETGIRPGQGIDGFRELPDAQVGNKLKVYTLLNLPGQVDGWTQTPISTLPDELPATAALNVEGNKENL